MLKTLNLRLLSSASTVSLVLSVIDYGRKWH
jgi:hypothetical protein